MKIAIVVIGDELLLGQVTDTNSGSIARIAGPEGWHVESVRVVGDNAGDIRAAIDAAFADAPVVLTTGGLGPTKDDITKALLADMFGGPLVEDASVLANVRSIMERRGLSMNALTAAQAMVPASCTVIQNRYGTAPLMWFDSPRGVLVAMPGVPFETVGMFSETVFPMLRKRFGDNEHRLHRTLITTGVSESALAERLAQWEESLPQGMHLAYLPNAGYIRLRLDSSGADEQVLEAETALQFSKLRELVGDNLVAVGDLTPAQILLADAQRLGLTIATAESCTGGNIAAAITAIPGASANFLGGIVAYSNDVKKGLLGVREATLAAHGAVSEQTAAEMAAGACAATGARIAMATSGIAGPGGGTPEKPVGTVCVAAALRQDDGSFRTVAVTHHFPGNRSRVVDRAVSAALLLAHSLLKD